MCVTRVRAKHADEHWEEDEKDWLQIDKLLSPHCFVVDPKKQAELDRRARALKDISSAEELQAFESKSLVNSVVPREIKGVIEASYDDEYLHKLHSTDPEYPLLDNEGRMKNSNRDGDMYQEMRWRFENGEVVFETDWKCPFTRNEILQIRNIQIDLLPNEDARRTKRLLDHFYVDDNQTALGRARLQTLLEVTNSIREGLESIDGNSSPGKVPSLQGALALKLLCSAPNPAFVPVYSIVSSLCVCMLYFCI